MTHFNLLIIFFMSVPYIVNDGVLMVVSVKVAFFWNVTLCSLVEKFGFFQRNVLYFPLFAMYQEVCNLITLVHL
jgi:hypothetical protein